jgi:hypothetical protein
MACRGVILLGSLILKSSLPQIHIIMADLIRFAVSSNSERLGLVP